METNKDSTGFEHRGVYNLFNEKNKKCLKHQILFLYFFIIIVIFSIYIFLYSWDGKVDMMSNLAEWRHE